jgi:hypothetical protein
MALLDMLQDAAVELRMPSTFTSVIGNTDAHVKLLAALANEEVQEVRRKYSWPQMLRDGSITLVSAQQAYALPADFYGLVSDSGWDSTQLRPMIGPISSQEWQARQRSGVSVAIYKEFRIRGIANNQLLIYPTPGAAEAGNVLTFEYRSLSCVRPKTWAAGVSFASNAYCFYNGNYYRTDVGGTTGATPPTHVTGSASDGTVAWTYSSATYERFLTDADVPLFDQQIVKAGIKWRWLKANGFDYGQDRIDYEMAVAQDYATRAGGRTLRLGGETRERLIDLSNVSDRVT